MFRAALPAILRRTGRRNPAVASAVLFGLWHVLPTLEELEARPVRSSPRTGTAAVIAAVAVTFLGAYAFGWLRDRSGHVAAPILAHAAANEASLLAGRAVMRSRVG